MAENLLLWTTGRQTSYLKVCVPIIPVYGTESTIVVSVFLQT